MCNTCQKRKSKATGGRPQRSNSIVSCPVDSDHSDDDDVNGNQDGMASGREWKRPRSQSEHLFNFNYNSNNIITNDVTTNAAININGGINGVTSVYNSMYSNISMSDKGEKQSIPSAKNSVVANSYCPPSLLALIAAANALESSIVSTA